MLFADSIPVRASNLPYDCTDETYVIPVRTYLRISLTTAEIIIPNPKSPSSVAMR